MVAPADFHAGERGQFRHQAVRRNGRPLALSGNCTGGQTDAEGEEFCGSAPMSAFCSAMKLRIIKPGANQQHERERDFGDDETVAHALTFRAARRRGAAAFFEESTSCGLEAWSAGNKPKDNARDSARPEGESEDAPVEIESESRTEPPSECR